MAAQMAVAMRTEAKELLKSERDKSDGVPIYYAQSLATMTARAAELAGHCASASLAALEHLDLADRMSSGTPAEDVRESTLVSADLLSQSAAHQALSAKLMYEALASALGSRSKSISEMATRASS